MESLTWAENWGARFECDVCKQIVAAEDVRGPGYPCPDEDCNGTTRLYEKFYWYDEETGMEYWHDGEDIREQCHDGVGLITRHHQTLDDFLTMFPNAEIPPS